MSNCNKVALICGISGQDGAYLAKFLLAKGYKVYGTSRDAQGQGWTNLIRLGILDKVTLLSMMPEDFRSVYVAVNKAQPDEIYFLAGQSSVGLSFELPAETIQSITLGTLNMLEACRLVDRPVRLYQSGSSECFGDTNGVAANERTPFQPRSPYAVAKASAFWLVDNYREAYNLYACTGILFNHESSLRPQRFVTQKIIAGARSIAEGSKEKLKLGRLDIIRDWGYAAEYVEAMWLMLQQQKPQDFIIATGESNSLESFVKVAFQQFGLDWREYVEQSKEFFRPTDLLESKADSSKAEKVLGWKASSKMSDVIKIMATNQL